jgi:DNA-binding response OmpR family regulator
LGKNLGEVITAQNLPPKDTRRWVVRRKQILAAAVITGLRTEDELLAEYQNLSRSELLGWVKILKEKGLSGLKTTKIQDLPGLVTDECLPAPVVPFDTVEVRGLRLSSCGHMQNSEGDSVHFTKSQTKLLGYLMQNPGVTVTKAAILQLLYPDGVQAEQKIIEIFISKIRKTIRDAYGVDFVETAWGRGYFIPS